jgi:uncharacterized protein YkuJ
LQLTAEVTANTNNAKFEADGGGWMTVQVFRDVTAFSLADRNWRL